MTSKTVEKTQRVGFVPNYPIDALVPAAYNPRRITPESLCRLRASVADLGLIKPVIVTTSSTIVAGHQRTKSLLQEGFHECPAFVLPPVGITDEVRFNQLHNASDLDAGDERVRVPPSASEGFVWVPASAISADTLRCRNACRKSEILRLMTKYGDWGSCVATQSGEVLVSGLYAMCCLILRRPCLVYYVPDVKRPLVEKYFGQAYGEFSYDHLPKTTWAQSLAQMMRLRERKTGKIAKSGDAKGKSRTYEQLVIPHLLPGMRVLDFGSGQFDYVKLLQSRKHQNGVDILGVEFYRRLGKHLNVPQVHRDIDAVCQALETHGRFDLVVCDSVLNSVDSVQAEQDVLTCLAALAKPGGTVIFSGRSKDSIELKATGQTTNTDANTRYVNFLDENGISAMYSCGVWRYQMFHDLADIRRLTETHFGSRYTVLDSDGGRPKDLIRASGWGVVATNDKIQDVDQYLPALRREFDLPLPDGKRYGRSDDIERAFRAAILREET